MGEGGGVCCMSSLPHERIFQVCVCEGGGVCYMSSLPPSHLIYPPPLPSHLVHPPPLPSHLVHPPPLPSNLILSSHCISLSIPPLACP